MNRRIVGVFVAVLTLGLFLAVLHFGGLAKSLEKYYVSDEEWAKIIDSRSEDTDLREISVTTGSWTVTASF